MVAAASSVAAQLPPVQRRHKLHVAALAGRAAGQNNATAADAIFSVWFATHGVPRQLVGGVPALPAAPGFKPLVQRHQGALAGRLSRA